MARLCIVSRLEHVQELCHVLPPRLGRSHFAIQLSFPHSLFNHADDADDPIHHSSRVDPPNNGLDNYQLLWGACRQ